MKNFGLSPLCTFGGSGSQEDGLANLDPPIWGASVIEQYRGSQDGLPNYVSENVTDNRRNYTNAAQVSVAG